MHMEEQSFICFRFLNKTSIKFEIAQLKNGNYFALKMYRRIAQDFMMQQPGATRILVDDFVS